MEKKWRSTSMPYALPNPAGQADAWSRSGGSQELLEVCEATPPAEVSEALQLEDGELAVVRRRLMRLDGTAMELTDSYYPPSIARGTRLAERRKIRGGASTLLASLGYPPARIQEDVEVRLATSAESGALGTSPGEPVMILLRTTLSTNQRPVEVSRMIMRSNARLHYEIEVD